MTMTAAAHIVTADASAMGDPELVITTRADEHTGEAELIEAYPLGTAESLRGLDELLPDYGWQIVSNEVTYVETGYCIVEVEKIEA